MVDLTLFYSYAHEDEAFRDQLEIHLIQLQREGLISTWHDREILSGSAWADEINANLEAASIILLLLSPDFLASNYCYEIEMKRALERHQRREACVIPIILRPCDWPHSPLKDLQCLPRDGKPVVEWDNPDAVFLDISKGLRRVIEQQESLARPLSPLNRQNRMRMLRQVHRIWIDGVLTQSLHHEACIKLHLQDRPDVLANPWRLQVQETNQAPKSLPDETTIVQVYDRADGELLILGEPGSGKTTLLLELARTLLERAEKDERFPMPIVFNLSSWAEKRQPLHIWLVEELRTKYQIPRKVAQGRIDTDQVLPLLDGLDEVARDARSACVEQINGYYQLRLERGSSPIVVCCRSEEYTGLSTRVMLQHAVSILPLTDSQINIYLEQAGEQVRGLRQALSEDAELHHLARQPLMLNIFTLAYQGAQASDIPTGETLEGMRHTIFAKYVERMLRRREQSKRWTSEQVIRWLAFLGKQMQRHDQTVFCAENLQPTWLSRGRRILYRWCVGLLAGLVFALVFALLVGLIVGPLAGPGVALVTTLVVTLVIEPVFALLLLVQFLWQSFNDRLRTVLSSVLIGILLLPLLLMHIPLLPSLPIVLFFLLDSIIVLPIGLVFWLAIGQLVEQDTRINVAEVFTWSWKKVRLNLGIGLIGCLGAGALAAGVSVYVADSTGNPGEGLIVGLISMLVFTLPAVLITGLSGGQIPNRLSLSPNEGIWRSGKNGLIVGLLVVLIFGLISGLIVLVLGPASGLTSGLIGLIGLVVGLVAGIRSGLNAFIKHFTLRFFLLRQDNLPWDLRSFLDEAAGRLLLRKVGGNYIFVHRMLLEYFAEVEEKDGSHRSQ